MSRVKSITTGARAASTRGVTGDLLDTKVYLNGKVVGVGRQGLAEVCLEDVWGILAEATLRGGQGI